MQKDEIFLNDNYNLNNNYSLIRQLDIRELKLLKYKYEMKAKQLRNRTTTMTTVSTIISIVLALISTSTKVVEKFDIISLLNIIEVFVLYIIAITSVGVYVKASLDMASEYETLVVMIIERIAEIKASDWNKAQLVKVQIFD